MLIIPSDSLRFDYFRSISSKTEQGLKGTVCFDGQYLYVCYEDNNWERIAYGAWGGIDHDMLVNLLNDSHTQYFILAGRSGGQTAIGGTGSGDDLTFQTTSHATKGSYIFSEMTTAGYLKNTAAGVVTGGNLGDLPSGSIIGWTGYLADCPTGFLVCDGTSGTPDLTDEFVAL